jgi:glutathione synthase
MPIQLGVVMDPIATINYKKDTTLALLWAAQARGWGLHYMEQADLFVRDGVPMANQRTLTVHQNPTHWFDLGSPGHSPLTDLDVILMRKDPPFDSEYIYSTYILELAQQRGTLIANNPDSLRECNEKFFTTHFPHLSVPTLVSRDIPLLKSFLKEQQEVIYKPLDAMGGTEIFRVNQQDPNINVILEVLTSKGEKTIMAQRYIPAIAEGDKRILVIDGNPAPYCLARIPAAGETRGNLAAGASSQVRPLTTKDRAIAEEVGAALKERGLYFVGLDVIGDYLTEINVTSPTGLREIEAAQPLGLADQLMTCLELQMGTR